MQQGTAVSTTSAIYELSTQREELSIELTICGQNSFPEDRIEQ